MRILTKLDSLAIFALALHLFLQENNILMFTLLLFLPDISIAGYIFGNKVGAVTYNFIHHKLLGVSFYLIGLDFDNEIMISLGLILVAHSALDHFWGYGFKTFRGFSYTSLGRIGK